MPKKSYRTFEEVDESGLLPSFGGLGFDPRVESRRYQAILEVLFRIPPTDFEKLEELSSSFHWFIPQEDELGKGMPFSALGDKSPFSFSTDQEPRRESNTIGRKAKYSIASVDGASNVKQKSSELWVDGGPLVITR